MNGRLSVHRDGYAFVIPDEPVLNVNGDIYVGKEEAERGMHGDRVAIRIKRLDRDGRAHGEIMEVLKRANLTVVGEFRIRRRSNFVVPHDERIRQWVEIPEGMAIPAAAGSPDRVGARAVEVNSEADLDGMIVTVEIIDFGEDGDRPAGRAVAILGNPDDFAIDLQLLTHTH